MNLTQYRCVNCGASDDLKTDGNSCKCGYCGATFFVDTVKEFSKEVRKIFGEAIYEQKEEAIANCRRNLWQAVHAEHISSQQVLSCVNELKKLLPDDFQANFYEVATQGTPKQINSFLRSVDISKHGSYIEDIVNYILRSLENSNVLPLKDLITRGLKNEKYTEYITKVEDEAAKIKHGLYSPQVPRDVFIAYSSKDYRAVNEIVEFLEENKISCFVALRNLRHGRGSVENYLNNLQTAIQNCKCVVFLSSDNSRDLDCDALKVELPYIKTNQPNMGRIEYILADYGSDTSYAVKLILEDFFSGQEYCRTQEDLIKRVLKYITGNMSETAVADTSEEVKYCISCGEKNPVKAKRCMECGGTEFAADYESYVRAKVESEYAKKYKSQPQIYPEDAEKKAEEERKKREEAARKAEAERKAREEATRKAREESARKAREESARKAEEERKVKENYPTLENYDKSEFEIEGTVLKKYKGKKSEVIIPQGVTSIANKAFYSWGWPTSIKIPNGVTSIGKEAFSWCSNLISITIPNSVTSIGKEAFTNCKNLSLITVESGNKNYYSIGNSVINISSKTLIVGSTKSVIPTDGSVTSIGDNAFYGCEGLKKIIIPNCVTSIGEQAFGRCEGLTSIIIPNSVTIINSWAFYGCNGLKNIYCESKKMPQNWDRDWLAKSTHNKCKAKVVWNYNKGSSTINQKSTVLTNLNYDKSAFKIKGTTLIKYKGEKSAVIIPEGVTTIGEEAFYFCTSLTSIVFPNSVTSIGKGAFTSCKNLASIKVEAGNQTFCSKNNCLIEISSKKLVLGCKTSVIPTDGSVTSIGDRAFVWCENLSSIIIPSSVTTIGNSAFSGCRSLENITFENGVTSISNNAFFDCESLTNISIPNSVASIGKNAFEWCKNIERITVDNDNKSYYSKDNCIIETSSKTLIRGCQNSVIPTDGSVTAIGDYAFDSCNGFTSIIIPDCVTSIGEHAFSSCKNLRSITIPNNMKSIASSAFRVCDNLTSITIPSSVETIGEGTFGYCRSLKTIYCEAKKRPKTWNSKWLKDCKAKVIWGYKG